MQTRPDHPTLLDAVAQFLLEDIAPRLQADKAARFRVLIAANVSSVVAGELRTHETREAQELARLHALLGSSPLPVGAHRGGTVALNAELVRRIREGSVDSSATLEHLLATAKETLEVTNPRFDLSEEV